MVSGEELNEVYRIEEFLECDDNSITLEEIKVLSKEQLELLFSRCINDEILPKSEEQILSLIIEKYKHLLDK